MAKNLSLYKKAGDSFLQVLSPRGREIVSRRFGLAGKKETLQAIGARHGITRERVRQIENYSIKALRAEKPLFASYGSVFNSIGEYFAKFGSVRTESALIKDLGSGGGAYNYLVFLLTLGEQFKPHGESKEFYPFWSNSDEAVSSAKRVASETAEEFKKYGRPMDGQTLYQRINAILADASTPQVSVPVFFSYLGISKLIKTNHFGEYGLRDFPEIHPRGVRDEAYIILKKENKPLHFVQVASSVSNLRKARGEKKNPAHAQTVHNELIKDPRFVLVGRGLYALKEWGYVPGVVREVIASVLKNSSKPLAKEQIVTLVKKQRFVQDNTIVLNLHNKKHFRRTDDGFFTLRT